MPTIIEEHIIEERQNLGKSIKSKFLQKSTGPVISDQSEESTTTLPSTETTLYTDADADILALLNEAAQVLKKTFLTIFLQEEIFLGQNNRSMTNMHPYRDWCQSRSLITYTV